MNVAGIDITQACIDRDPARRTQCFRRCWRTVCQFPVWVKSGEVQRHIGAEAIVEKVASDAAIKGAVVTSGKDTFCAAPISPCWKIRIALRRADKDAGPGGGECAAVRGGPQALADLPPHRDLRQALGRGAQRNGDGRRFELALACVSDNDRTRLGLPEIKVGCSRAAAARNASRACCRRPTRCSFCSRATSSASTAPRR
jgi:hypothetical protein